jgi:SAM-dependent methyltransferase
MMLPMGETPLRRLRAGEIKSEETGPMPACPVCDCGRTETTARHSDFDRVSVFQCMNCSHHFAYPEPDSNRLALYYGRAYRKHRLGPSYCELMRRRADAQIRFIKRYLLTAAESFAVWKVCDIGCGIGALVARFEREGALAKGYDLDSTVIRFGKNHWKSDLRVGGLETTRLQGRNFDLLCFSHVIEHLPDIQRSIAEALEGLREEGYLFIEVPRYSEEMFESPLKLESHLHFFTPTSLTALLKGLGLSVIACATCGPPEHPLAGWEVNKGSSSAAKIRLIWNWVLLLLNQRDCIKTLYDGFYERYYQTHEAGGIWIRCLARKKGVEHGSARPHPC